MDQIHRSPTRWETKRKRREGAPRTPSPAMASSPKLQRIGTATTPGKKRRTRSGEPTGSYPGCSPPPSPGARLLRSPVAAGDTGGHDVGRLRSRREVGCSKSTTFCLQHHASARAGAEEYQGSHKEDKVTYHAPWKGNQWSGSPNLPPRHPGTIASTRPRKIPRRSQAFFYHQKNEPCLLSSGGRVWGVRKRTSEWNSMICSPVRNHVSATPYLYANVGTNGPSSQWAGQSGAHQKPSPKPNPHLNADGTAPARPATAAPLGARSLHDPPMGGGPEWGKTRRPWYNDKMQ